MIALSVLLGFVCFFWLGKLVGRAEGTSAVFEHFARMYKDLSIEDKLLFDRWMQEYKQKYFS